MIMPLLSLDRGRNDVGDTSTTGETTWGDGVTVDVHRREGGEIEGTLISISCDFASGKDGWVVKWVSATHQSLMRLPSKRPTESIDMKAPCWRPAKESA